MPLPIESIFCSFFHIIVWREPCFKQVFFQFQKKKIVTKRQIWTTWGRTLLPIWTFTAILDFGKQYRACSCNIGLKLLCKNMTSLINMLGRLRWMVETNHGTTFKRKHFYKCLAISIGVLKLTLSIHTTTVR